MNLPTKTGWYWRRSVCVRTGQPNPWQVVQVIRDEVGELVIEFDNGHQAPPQSETPEGFVRYEWIGPIQPPP